MSIKSVSAIKPGEQWPLKITNEHIALAVRNSPSACVLAVAFAADAQLPRSAAVRVRKQGNKSSIRWSEPNEDGSTTRYELILPPEETLRAWIFDVDGIMAPHETILTAGEPTIIRKFTADEAVKARVNAARNARKIEARAKGKKEVVYGSRWGDKHTKAIKAVCDV